MFGWRVTGIFIIILVLVASDFSGRGWLWSLCHWVMVGNHLPERHHMPVGHPLSMNTFLRGDDPWACIHKEKLAFPPLYGHLRRHCEEDGWEGNNNVTVDFIYLSRYFIFGGEVGEEAQFPPP